MQNRRLGFFASSAAIALLVSFTLSARVWGSETVLFDFSGSEGSSPHGGLISDSAGNLYGTTSRGGTYEVGTVFELLYQGGTKYTEKVLYSFTNGSDGGSPQASLVFDQSLNLYGTTETGGSNDEGVVFEVIKSENYAESVLYSFTGGSDGGGPSALVRDKRGNLYGTTVCGGSGSCTSGGGYGVVFELVKSNGYSERVLYTFTGGADGGSPLASVTLDAAGNLYGTTVLGGSNTICISGATGCGVVFELIKSEDYAESVLYSFTGGSDGGEAKAPVVLDKMGNLYGTAYCGGSSNCAGGSGVVFELLPTKTGPWKESLLHTFQGSDGSGSTAGLAFDTRFTHLYGTTYYGGTGGLGTVFRIGLGSVFQVPISETKFMSLYSFKGGDDGASPFAGVAYYAYDKGRCGKGCGFVPTASGGTSGQGTVVKIYGFKE